MNPAQSSNGQPAKKKIHARGKSSADPRKLIDACVCSEEEAYRLLSATRDGLSADAARTRLDEVGPNTPASAKKMNIFSDFFHRGKDPLVIQLLIISLVALAMGDVRSAVVVAFMLLLSVVLAYIQEQRSIHAAEQLQKLVQASAVVVRDNREVEIPLTDVVPGDIVVLTAGSIIPADMRLVSAKDFFVNLSSMTGESMPVEKTAVVPKDAVREPLDLPNACFQGSTVVSGAARGIAVCTGGATLLGAIAKDIAKEKTDTSFDRGVKSFVWLMVRFMIVMVTAVFFIVGFTKHDWAQALLFGLSVAVGLTPEMLPMIMTVCLSKGALTMSRKKVIVKKLKAIQNFGAMNVLCTDKTGTLTQDKIVLERYVDVTNRESADVLRYAYMNSYYQTGLRNLLDKAILGHEDLDVERSCRKVDELPFDFVRKRMSVIIDYEDMHVMICKGAVEEVYGVSNQYQVDDEIYPLIEVVRSDLMEEYQRLSSDGYRVLAVAYKEFPKDKELFSAADENGLILLGYLAFFDPPKESSAQALKALGEAGVRVKILTGDNELVTRNVCRNVGLPVETVVTGSQLFGLNDEQLCAVVNNNVAFARLSPMQKETIITCLQKQGNTVGFLGDGINDAAALKAADVGISVDTAVDVAKESADIILLERSLLVLQEGIVEGRKIFANIIKYIKMGASSNFGNMFSVVGGSYFLPFLPMAPIQVLLNNLLYDISQTGIPTDSVDEDMVKKPQNWDVGFIRRFMTVIGPISSLFDYATFFLMLYFFKCILFKSASTPTDVKAHLECLFHTGWFVESIFTQTVIVYIIRTNKIPFLQSRPSPGLLMSTLGMLAVGAFLPYSPFATYLGLVPLPLIYWAWIAGFLACYSVMTHFAKTWFNRRFGV
jgi:P-type Mg2+ transporter